MRSAVTSRDAATGSALTLRLAALGPHRPERGFEVASPPARGVDARDRGELLTALLTVARAWYAAGEPAGVVPQLGSSSVGPAIGGILTHAGAEGFLGNLDELYDETDEASQEWETFLQAIDKAVKGRTFTPKTYTNKSSGPDKTQRSRRLPSDLADKEGRITSSKALGQALRKRLNTRYGEANIRLEVAGKDSRNKSPLWQIRSDRVKSVIRSRNIFGSSKPNPQNLRDLRDRIHTVPIAHAGARTHDESDANRSRKSRGPANDSTALRVLTGLGKPASRTPCTKGYLCQCAACEDERQKLIVKARRAEPRQPWESGR